LAQSHRLVFANWRLGYDHGAWVIPTGGGYFFVPSITALREVIAR
jgi:hypothetical protein